MNSNKGFIALTTVLFLTAIILLLVVTFGTRSFLVRRGGSDLRQKETSYFVAQSCLDYGRLFLERRRTYAGNETVSVGSYSCHLEPIETQGATYILEASGTVGASMTRLRLVVDEVDLSTVSLEEKISF